MNIKYIRNKIRDKKWLNKKLRELYKQLKDLHTYETFECTEFFVGKFLAERNRRYYNSRYKKLIKQINFLKRCGAKDYD